MSRDETARKLKVLITAVNKVLDVTSLDYEQRHNHNKGIAYQDILMIPDTIQLDVNNAAPVVAIDFDIQDDDIYQIDMFIPTKADKNKTYNYTEAMELELDMENANIGISYYALNSDDIIDIECLTPSQLFQLYRDTLEEFNKHLTR